MIVLATIGVVLFIEWVGGRAMKSVFPAQWAALLTKVFG